ncbi:transglycosylase domain-containing protein, partial [Candidatus Dojkabacteria bacterium]|nr:transglycosylase domain-containing protein [Candidatus Dojkabacteria bacterium]
MKTIAIVHTVKLDRKGKPRQNYLHRLNAAIELTKHHKIDEIILFGGKTRKKFPSEAKVGQNYLKGKVKVPTTLETVSKATIDSVLNIKKLIKIDKVNKIYVITSDYSLERFKFLYSELYPEAKGKLEFISTKDESGLRFKYAQKFYLAYSKLVPEGGIIAKILQAIFRNGDLDEVKIEKLAKSKSKKSSSRKRDRFLLPFRKGNRRKTFIISSVTLLLFILIFGSFSFFYIKSFDKDLPPPDRLSTRNSKLSTTIYDRNGKELYKFFKDENRELVKLDDLPEYTKLSFLAAEDAEFYNHKGLDYPGIARCFVLTVTNKLSAGHLGNFCGASTITQQLIRNTLMYDVFGNDAYERSSLFPSIRRKLMEMTLALKVDQTYSKDEILQMYLNEVYLGGQTYGIQAASKEYFNKDAKDLSLSESAFLAGILQGPTIYNPVSGTNPELGINRQQYVLGQIEKHFQNDNELTFENIENAKEEELKFVFDPGEIYAPHFVFYVQDYLNKKFAEEGKDENYFQSGLKITTSLDLDLQDKIQAEVTKSITDYKEKYNVNNAAVVAIDPNTFEIIAMLGSANYNEESLEGAGKVNSALSYRQPASTVKPYTYLTAVRQGYGMNFPAPDIEALGKVYGTVNADFLYEGPMTARKALVRSRNIPALYTFELVGQDNFLDTTTKLGIESFNERKHLGELLTL